MKIRFVIVGLIFLVAKPIFASDQTIFEEDFESYSAGSNLSDQPGWVADTTFSDPIIISTGTNLNTTNVANGLIDPFTGGIGRSVHSLSIPAGALITLSFDGYAISSPKQTTGSTVGLTNGTGGFFGWGAWIDTDTQCPGGWLFLARPMDVFDATTCFNLPGARDNKLRLETVLDPTTEPEATAIGRIFDVDSGIMLFETPPIEILPAARIESLNDIRVQHDYRRRNFGQDGAEFDNIVVTATFDPTELILKLVSDVLSLNLQNGIENSLDSKLQSAVDALEDANDQNDVAAINKLIAFINNVEAQSGNAIDSNDADQLIATANQIIAVLGG